LSIDTRAPAPTNKAQLLQQQIQQARSDARITALTLGSLKCQAAYAFLDALEQIGVGNNNCMRAKKRARTTVANGRLSHHDHKQVKNGVELAESVLKSIQTRR
jgi:hypothetical protein